MTPLHYAVEVQSIDIIKILIRKYAELNARNDQGQTPLHLACKSGSIEIVKELTKIKDEIFVDIQDEEGNTPLHLAAKLNLTKIVQHLLVDSIANCLIVNNLKQKPRDIA